MTYDLLGIGLGPFNLSLAALCHEIPQLSTAFIEQKDGFDWHPRLLLPGTRLQVPFYAGAKDFLIEATDPATDTHGYRDQAGKMVIPLGKYPVCYTDTFRNYAIVWAAGKGIVAIDRNEKVLYSVFVFDNGPDDPADGLFRIRLNGKIGYADSATGEVVIQPKYACAWPFENGKAKVAFDCQIRRYGEYSTWASGHWMYIDKRGATISP